MTTLFEQLGDRKSAAVRDALTRQCEICQAPAGSTCTNMPINSHRLSGRLVHFMRTEA